jgi:tetratricopeptide (TPR) repeat protein
MKQSRILFFCAVAWLAGMPVVMASPMDDAETLIQNHQFEAALAKFSGISRAESDQVLILRLEGVCFIKLKRFPEAETVLKQATTLDQTNVASRFYLGQALASQGKIAPSIPLLESVVHDAPDSAYAGMCEKVLPGLRNLLAATSSSTTSPQAPSSYSQNGNSVIFPQKIKRWGLTLSISGAYDDNINEEYRQPNNVAALSGFSFITSDEIWGTLLDERIDNAPLTIRSTFDFYQNVHDTGATSHYDVTTYDGALSFEKTVNLGKYPTRFLASGGYRNESEGGSKLDDSFTGAASAVTSWNDWLSSTIYYTYGQYNYYPGNYFPSLFDRSGGVSRVGVYPTFSLFHGNWKLQPVYEFNSYGTQGIEYDASGNTVGITSRLELPAGFTLINGFQWENEYYNQFAPTPKRTDNIYDVSASISHSIFIPELTGNISEFFETTDSSQPFACYTRNIISIGVTYTY